MHGVHSLPLSLNLNLLVVLDALLRERNVTRAARRIGLSQSATSHALGRLREALGDELLVRGAAGLEPTERARAIGPQLARALAELGAVLRAPEPFDPDTFAGELTIATGDFIAAAVGPRLAVTLGRVSPRLRVRFIGLDARDLGAALDEQKVDLAVGPAMSVPASVARVPWATTPFACAVRRGHPALGGKLSLARYCALSHIQIAPTGRGTSVVDEALAARGLARRVALRTDSFLLAPLVAAESDLVLTAPRLVFDNAVVGSKLALLAPPLALPELQLQTYWDARRGGDAKLAWLRQVVHDLARRVPEQRATRERRARAGRRR